MTQAQPSQTNSTYGDGLSVAFELVATPAVFGLMGFGLDRWLGTAPLFVITFSAVALATVVGLTIWRYGLEMDRVDTERRTVRAANGVRRARWERAPEFEASEFETSEFDAAGFAADPGYQGEELAS